MTRFASSSLEADKHAVVNFASLVEKWLIRKINKDNQSQVEMFAQSCWLFPIIAVAYVNWLWHGPFRFRLVGYKRLRYYLL